MYVLNMRAHKHYREYNHKTLDRSQVILFKPWNPSRALSGRSTPGAHLHSHLYMYRSVIFVHYFSLIF